MMITELSAKAIRDELTIYYNAYLHHITSKQRRIDFKAPGYGFQEQIYFDRSPRICIKKSTQCGISEYLIVRSVSKLKRGRNVFYVIPKWELIKRFVKKRWEASVKYTPEYARGLVGEGRSDSQSMALKTMWGANITFVGSNSESGFAEFVADDVIIDELDHCYQDYLPMAEERQGDSEDPTSCRIANPSYPNYGIDVEYKNSNQKKYHVKCPHCNKWLVPDFFKHVVRQTDAGDYAAQE